MRHWQNLNSSANVKVAFDDFASRVFCMSGPPVQSIRLRNFKRFENFYLSARVGNILVGPNNSGKSSILDALRAASARLRFARSGPSRPIEIANSGPVRGEPPSYSSAD